MKKIGLIVNPIAGMGGRVGLKGTDGEDILKKAKELGASMEAPSKAQKALRSLLEIKEELLIVTCSGIMGEDIARNLGFKVKVVYSTSKETSSQDTKVGAGKILEEEVEILLFVGGDGTARDIYEVVGTSEVTLGIPAGVKIHSPVYGNTPENSGKLAFLYLTGGIDKVREEEVVDIDEEAFRNDRMTTSLYGYLKVPVDKKFMQNKKAPTPLDEESTQKAIALDIIDNMEDDTYYVIGPGTTPRAIMKMLNLPYTLLGVDILKDKKIVELDCSEKDILHHIKGKKTKLILTPTGGQGYLLGRGNQQISSRVIEEIGKRNITIISTDSKLVNLRGEPLLVYTGDEETDKSLRGYYRVKVGYEMEKMYLVSN